MPQEHEMQYLFGPVMSRRLGRSLGVDVIPFKTCTYDCVYCQLGRTTEKTCARREYVPLAELVGELRRKVADGLQADYITIAGSGEPTLYSRLGELISAIKELTDIPVAVLTNGSLCWDPAVREALAKADLVVPSLDAADPDLFETVNRPAAGIGFEAMIEGLEAFRAGYRGQIWLEVFLLAGVSDAQVARLVAAARRIRPDRVQLNTVERPTPGFDVAPVPREQMEHFAAMFGGLAEIVAHYAPVSTAPGQTPATAVTTQDVLALIRRHPCTLKNLAEGFGLSEQEAAFHVRALLNTEVVRATQENGEEFYLAES